LENRLKILVHLDNKIAQPTHEFTGRTLNFGIEFEVKAIRMIREEDKINAANRDAHGEALVNFRLGAGQARCHPPAG
jgi:hypothetical protein